jgi:DNA repair ATPase RecN
MRDMSELEELKVELNRISRELKTIRELASDAVNYMRNAEAEIPEKIRRFMNYMHDLHDIRYMYEELGSQCPPHHLREMERCDDRFRQLIKELHLDGGAFEKIRRDMADDPENRYDHTRLLYPPKEKDNGL